jgi:predicted aspartyl protease
MSLQVLLAKGAGLLLAAAWTTLLSAQAPPSMKADSFIPFDLVSNFEIVVQGRIGELDGLKLIIDTGSSYSVLDRSVADRLGLACHPGKVFNFDRNLAVEWAEVPEIRIGPIRAARLGMMVTSLADISEFAKNADGIIGMDVLSRAQKLRIDYERRRISFEFDKKSEGVPTARSAFIVPVVIQGASMHLLVDTGLQYLVLYKDRLHTALPRLRIEGEPRRAAIGHLQVTQVHLPGVEIFGRGAVTPVLLIDEHGKTGVDRLDGYLGPASLHARRLELDFAAKMLRWE